MTGCVCQCECCRQAAVPWLRVDLSCFDQLVDMQTAHRAAHVCLCVRVALFACRSKVFDQHSAVSRPMQHPHLFGSTSSIPLVLTSLMPHHTHTLTLINPSSHHAGPRQQQLGHGEQLWPQHNPQQRQLLLRRASRYLEMCCTAALIVLTELVCAHSHIQTHTHTCNMHFHLDTQTHAHAQTNTHRPRDAAAGGQQQQQQQRQTATAGDSCGGGQRKCEQPR